MWLEAHAVKGVDPMSGEVFPSLDMAVKAAVMGQGITMGDIVLVRDELETGMLVRPLQDLTLTTDWEGYCLFGPSGFRRAEAPAKARGRARRAWKNLPVGHRF